MKLPAANGKSATVGFCWGGATTFAWAMRQDGLDAAVVYYGTGAGDAVGRHGVHPRPLRQ